MTKIKKLLTLLLVFCICAALIQPAIYAEPETKTLFVLDRTYNMAVTILFDKTCPTVSFTSPDGIEIEGESIKHDKGEDWIQFYIEAAMPGEWKITYDKLDNTEFSISYSSYMLPISITSFTLSQPSNKHLPVSFTVSGGTEAFEYAIYAVLVDSSGYEDGEKKLYEGRGMPDNPYSLNINVSSLADYSGYRLRLDVWREDGVEEVFDSKLSTETFDISGGNIGKLDDSFVINVNLTDSSINVDWSKLAKSTYLVAIFDDSKSKTEPLFFNEYDSDTTSCDILFEPQTKELRVEITEMRNGSAFKKATKLVPIDNGVKIDMPAVEATSSSQIKVNYETNQDIKAEVICGEKKSVVELKNSGYFTVALAAGNNSIEVKYNLGDENVIYTLFHEISFDNIPPILRLPENKTAINTTDGSFTLVGITDPGVTVKINGTEVSVGEDGIFMQKLDLQNGENVFSVSAVSDSGNTTMQNVVIFKTSPIAAWVDPDSGEPGILQKYFPLIVSFAASLLLMGIFFLVSYLYGKRSDKKSFVLHSVRNTSIGGAGLSFAFLVYCLVRYLMLRSTIHSDKFFDMANESIEKAADTLAQFGRYSDYMLYSGIALVVFAIALAASIIAIKLKNAKPTEPAAVTE